MVASPKTMYSKGTVPYTMNNATSTADTNTFHPIQSQNQNSR